MWISTKYSCWLILNLQKSHDPILKDFINSEHYEKSERLWIGDGTIYSEVKHLMPNYFLDVLNIKTERYWVIEDVNASQEMDSAVMAAGEILRGSIKAISSRYDCMLAVTAGWDSRAFTASKDVQDRIRYFVSTMNRLTPEHMDIKVPSKLLKKLGLKLNIVDNLSPVSEEIETTLQRNVTMARNLPKTLTIQYHFDHSGDKVNINGNASEIIRSFYGDNHPKILMLVI